MERIVFLERGTFTVDFRRPEFPHEWVDYSESERGDVGPRLAQATIAIVNKLRLRGPQLAQLRQLKMIAVAATGVDNIDLEFCRRTGIAVSNVTNYAGTSVPEHVLMLMLTLRRNLIGYHEDVRQGNWQSAKQFCLLDHPIHDINGATLGIVGYGFLGKAVERLATAIGMKVLVSERKSARTVREGRVAFEDLLKLSDVITLHCPLTPETRDLIAAPEFHQMRRSAILINTARGGLVNEADLLTALRTKTIAGAGVDVLRREPPTDGNVLLNAQMMNLIVTPHVAWSSREAMRTLADQLVENLEAFMRGESKNRVV